MSIFDSPVDRRGGDAIKWAKYAGREILPMWVADMDFAAPPAVLEALEARIAHGVFGYGEAWPGLTESVLAHLSGEYGWEVEPEWLVWLPGLVTGLNVACRSVDGAVLTATPIYPPFLSAPKFSGRSLQRAELNCSDGHWAFDEIALLAASTAETALFLLCHPHNPVGRCWTEQELRGIGDLAIAHDWIVCSDEIHCGLILDEGRRHQPFASLASELADRTITLMAPSKTFNVPGLGCAFAVISNPLLRQSFQRAMRGIVPHVNVLGLVACEAAFRHAANWHSELIAYLRNNRDVLQATVVTLPGISMSPVEATYLAWLDVRGLNLPNPAAHFEAHGLGLSDGADFGATGYLRLNFGCPRSTLEEGLKRLAAAVRSA